MFRIIAHTTSISARLSSSIPHNIRISVKMLPTPFVRSYGSHFPTENGESNMGSHYTDISSKFDYLFEHTHQANTPMIIKKLQLTPDDLLVDIGAATGQQAHLLWKHVGLKTPVTCVEPCESFFNHAIKLDGIVPVVETAEQFCDHLGHVVNQKPFNKVLLCAVVHHIDDIEKCIGQIIDFLPKNGVCLILIQPCLGLVMPFSPLQLKNIEEIPDYTVNVIVPFVNSRDDVITEVTNEESTCKMPKSRWYYMIRNRFWSSFCRYTDQELEESIKELDNQRFQGVKDDELITVVDKYIGIKLTKK